jgi:hypothetical protein
MTDQEPMGFDRAEYDAEGAKQLTCAFCGQPVPDYYYHVGGKLACKHCQPKIAAELTKSPRFWRAAAFGAGAALLGSAIWYAIIAATGYELGLIAIVVGFMVGAAVRKGAGGVGGLSLQLLAAFLAYSGIVFAYLPLFYKEFKTMARQEQAASGGFTIGAAPGDEAATTVSPEAVAGAEAFLRGLDVALGVWADTADRGGRDGALEDAYGALRTLLAADRAPAFAFGDSIVRYHGTGLDAFGTWTWSPRLAAVGYPVVAFDSSVTRLDLAGLLDGASQEIAGAEGAGAAGVALGAAVLLAFLYLAPFLAGIQNVMGILIIGFGVWQAWRMNRRVTLAIEGPFEVKPAGPAPA